MKPLMRPYETHPGASWRVVLEVVLGCFLPVSFVVGPRIRQTSKRWLGQRKTMVKSFAGCVLSCDRTHVLCI